MEKKRTIDQRARAASNRINKKVAERYPLFADQFYTTEAEQKARIIDSDIDNAIHFEYRKDWTMLFWYKVENCKRVLVSLGMQAEIDRVYVRYYRWYNRQVVYVADSLTSIIAEYFGIIPCSVDEFLIKYYSDLLI